MGIKERKEREKEQRREHIIKISEKLFLGKDIQSITMDEIARESELSKGTLYIYFKSKEEIFLNICYKAISLLYDMYVDAVSGNDSPINKLRAMGENYIAFYDKYPVYYKLLVDKSIPHLAQNKPGTKEIGGKIIERTNDVWNLSRSIIAEGIKKGIFKKDTDPGEVAVSLWAMSTIFVDMKDRVKQFDHSGKNGMPFEKLDFKTLLITNGWRIIYSILKNPSEFGKIK